MDARAIIGRSVVASESDWRAEPNYDHFERDDDGDDAKTYDIRMIEGTPYERLIAVNDRPLSASRQREEQRQLEQAMAARKTESPDNRASRLDEYRKRHERVHAMFGQLTQAFDFRLTGTRRIGGRQAYVLAATPRDDYQPPNVDARVLTGMIAEFLVDIETFHWVKVTARLTRATSIVGLLVRAEPGTSIELEKAEVEPGIWLTSHLLVRSNSRLLFFIHHRTFEDDRYFNYRPAGATGIR